MNPVLVASSLAILSVLAAGSIEEMGSEKFPELLDAEGDVVYHSLHQTARNHEYLDLVAGWFAHEAEIDNVSVSLRAVDATSLSTLPRDWQVSCHLEGTVRLEGRNAGTLGFGWYVQIASSTNRQPVLTSRASFQPTPEGLGPARPLTHRFSLSPTEPAYYEFSISRQTLLSLGEDIYDLNARCFEWYQPATTMPTYKNEDGAVSKGAYSWKDLRRLQGPGGEPEPWEQEPATTTQSTEPPADTSGQGVVATILLVVVITIVLAGLKRR